MTGALLHFKFFAVFHYRARMEAARGQHWDGGAEYVRYAALIDSVRKASLFYEGSELFSSTQQLVELGLVKSCPEFDWLADGRANLRRERRLRGDASKVSPADIAAELPAGIPRVAPALPAGCRDDQRVHFRRCGRMHRRCSSSDAWASAVEPRAMAWASPRLYVRHDRRERSQHRNHSGRAIAARARRVRILRAADQPLSVCKPFRFGPLPAADRQLSAQPAAGREAISCGPAGPQVSSYC